MKLGSLRFTLAALVFLVMLCSLVAAQAQKETPPQQSSSDTSNAQSQTSAQTDQEASRYIRTEATGTLANR